MNAIVRQTAARTIRSFTRGRTGRLGLATLTLALSALFVGGQTAQAAPLSNSATLLSCSSGVVRTTAPTVYGEQQNWAFRYQAQLLRYDSRYGWQHAGISPIMTAWPAGTDASVGTSYGIAGPKWFLNGYGFTTSYGFNVTPGYTYAIYNWTTDVNPSFTGGGWTGRYATTGYYGAGLSYCRA